MRDLEIRARRLGVNDTAEIVDALAASFYDYSIMTYILGSTDCEQ